MSAPTTSSTPSAQPGPPGARGPPKTCKPLWIAAITGDDPNSTTSPVVANGVVYVAGNYTDQNELYAFSAAGTTGCSGTPKICKPLWTAALNGYPNLAPRWPTGLSTSGQVTATSTPSAPPGLPAAPEPPRPAPRCGPVLPAAGSSHPPRWSMASSTSCQTSCTPSAPRDYRLLRDAAQQDLRPAVDRR